MMHIVYKQHVVALLCESKKREHFDLTLTRSNSNLHFVITEKLCENSNKINTGKQIDQFSAKENPSVKSAKCSRFSDSHSKKQFLCTKNGFIYYSKWNGIDRDKKKV